jgi:hypothetical protein
MFRNRFLILLGVCFLAASAALADDVGYVDCSNHSEDSQVFGKPRRSPDVVASLPCGERFTILVYGFVFSRIQTREGSVGYIYSSLIAIDRAATSAQQSGSLQFTAAKTKIPSTRTPVAKPAPAAPAQPQSVPDQPASASTTMPTPAVAASNATETTVTVAQPNPPAQPQPALAQPASTPAPAPASPATASSLPEVTLTAAQPAPPAPPPPQPAAAQPASAPSSLASTANAPEPAATVAQPKPSAPAQPEPPSPAQPAPAPIRPAAIDRTTWETPNPGLRRRAPLLELYGGYSFARLVASGSGTSSNLNGAMGSFGWNIKPWLQIVGDSSYNVVTVSVTKNVLYGNHFGPRYFHRSRNRWGITPFVEALVGGSRADTTVTGTGGYTTSSNCLSYKAGGGIDIHPSRHFDIRLFDVDYYRTAFGANLHQNNYWASTGIVIRLFGGNSD